MKQTQEFDGKNIDAAVNNACSELSVSRKQLVYDVISSGSTGIFGIVGVKKARIRVTLPDKKRTPAEIGEDSRDLDTQGVMSIVDEAFGKDTTPAPPPEKQKETKQERPPEKQKEVKQEKPPAEKQEKPGKRFKSTPAAKKRTARPASSRTKPAPEKKIIPPAAPETGEPVPEAPSLGSKKTERPEPRPEPRKKTDAEASDISKDISPEKENIQAPDDLEPISDRDEGYPPKYADEVVVEVSEEAMELGRQTLQQMVDLITSDAVVVALRDEDRLLLKVEGGNSGVLIGRRGQTLEAMQFLTDKIINRFSESRVRLKVDIEGYMETRKTNLRALANKMADKARKTGKPATINQMTAQDRRIVHLALKDDTRVRTQSMGDGYYRRLVIFPKKKNYKKRRNIKK